MQTPKGEYLAYQKHVRGRSAVDTLPSLLTGILRDLAFPKQMHWDAMLDDGRGELLFGRPIRWLLFLYGGRVVPFTIGRAANAASSLVQDVESGALTYGHRFLATSGRAGRSIKVRSFDEYQARLAEHFVVLEHAERRDRITRDLDLHARRLGGRVPLKDHAALVEEVADLVEFPGVVAGFYPATFLELPHEVLVDDARPSSALLPGARRERQAQGSVPRGREHAAGRRAADREERRARGDGAAAGREVLLGRRPEGDPRIAARAPPHAHVPQEARQLPRQGGAHRALARWIAESVFERPDAAEHAATAARLAKADLTTDMVFEFPELQGTMGGIYAREEGQPSRCGRPSTHQYLPIGVEADAPPSHSQLGEAAVTWAAVSLADKLDTVAGLTIAGEARPVRAIRSGCAGRCTASSGS